MSGGQRAFLMEALADLEARQKTDLNRRAWVGNGVVEYWLKMCYICLRYGTFV